MRRLWSWQLSALLLVGMAAGALENSNQSSQSPDNPPDSTTPAGAGATATTPAPGTPSVTVTSQKPRNEPTLPKLAPDKFTECYGTNNINGSASVGLLGSSEAAINWEGVLICQAELARDTRIVIAKCINRDGKSAPPRGHSGMHRVTGPQIT